jgi:hypothetical protein
MHDVSVTRSKTLIRFFTAASILVLSLLTASCWQQQDGDGASGTSGRTDVSLTIPVESIVTNIQPLKSALGTHSDIVLVTVDVFEGTSPLITAQELVKVGDVYTGSLLNLPVGPVLSFIVHAYDSLSVEIFSGTTIQPLTGSGDTVTSNLAPVDDGTGFSIPSIPQIEYLKHINPLDTGMIRFTVGGTLNEELTYQITADAGGGAFLPVTGSINVTSPVVTLITTYSAPAAIGTYEHSFTLANNQGNSITVYFETVVSNNLANGEVEVNFYPVVAALGGKRVDDNVIWSAVISDDDPQNEMAYLWTFDGGLSFEDDATNPANLLSYSTAATGNLGLTVTDNFGAGSSTQISYLLVAGQFPNPGDIITTGILSYLLPDTGQTQSFSGIFGEDSDYTGYSPSYSDNGNGTVTDNLSTLMWEQDVDLNTKNWPEADTHCQNLALAGHSDWRLPSMLELKDIIDYGSYNPALNNTYYNADTDTLRYWSTDQESGNTWIMNFTRGTSSKATDTTNNYVRCVRGSAVANGTLTDNGDNTVSDNVTGLIWQGNEGGVSTWDSALTYCETLSLGGFSDWRIPNIKELFSIVDLGSTPTIDTVSFPTAVGGPYWSSTTRIDSAGFALVQEFSSGMLTIGYKTGTSNIRCVRSNL